jgi:hypothetical protein
LRETERGRETERKIQRERERKGERERERENVKHQTMHAEQNKADTRCLSKSRKEPFNSTTI